MPIARKDVAPQDRWNLATLYPNLEEWKRDLKSLPPFASIATYKGKLGESAKNLHETLKSFFEVERKLRSLYTYAHLLHDEEITLEESKQAFDTIVGIYHQFSQEMAWMQPEILEIDETRLKEYLKDPTLKEYHFFLEKLIRLKPHTLREDQEELMALAGQALDAPSKIFSAINNADFKFGTIKTATGEEKELTHASYGLFLREPDRILRQNAFFGMHRKFLEYENSLTEVLAGAIQSHVFNAKARKYRSCLEAALYPKNIDLQVYRSLIEAVHSKIGLLQRYLKLRKKTLGVKELHYYDLYVPLLPNVDMKFSYDEAEQLVIDSMQVLGPEYANMLHEGLKTGRWVDRYENENKRSGAYSSGCYDSMPYILMNYKGILRDVFTLAHEAGHSMHSLLSRKSQPYHYSDYAIFVAEVASTFNEEFLMRALVKKAKTDAEKAFLINEKLEDIRGTLFRQVMFAEFELFIHEAAEKRLPITPKFLKDKYMELNSFYFGNEVVLDPEVAIEWARIPHFYYDFYVYQYATGISAALALAEHVHRDGDKARDNYLAFLRSGSSDYPINELARAGCDLRTPKPILEALEEFGELTQELETILETKNLAVATNKC